MKSSKLPSRAVIAPPQPRHRIFWESFNRTVFSENGGVNSSIHDGTGRFWSICRSRRAHGRSRTALGFYLIAEDKVCLVVVGGVESVPRRWCTGRLTKAFGRRPSQA